MDKAKVDAIEKMLRISKVFVVSSVMLVSIRDLLNTSLKF